MDQEKPHILRGERITERLAQDSEPKEDELLERLLSLFFPCAEHKKTAKRLLYGFGSLSAVLHTEANKLAEIDGVDKRCAETLVLIGKILERMDSHGEKDVPSPENFQDFKLFLMNRFSSARQEFAELYGLKSNKAVIACRRFTSDRANKVWINPLDIAKFVSNFQPAQVLLVHNHVSESFLPSHEDDVFTAHLYMELSRHGIALLDHLIVSPKGVYSYSGQNALEPIKAQCESFIAQIKNGDNFADEENT